MTKQVKIVFTSGHLETSNDAVDLTSPLELIIPEFADVEVDGKLTDAKNLLVGDKFSYSSEGAVFSGTITEVLIVEKEISHEEHEARQEKKIASLESRVGTLETALIANNQALQNLQRTIVELTAHHIDHVLSNPVMVDTLAQRFLIAGANAIAHKAKTSKERAPQLVVTESLIPGCMIRAKLNEEGTAEIEQLDRDGSWVGGDQLDPAMREESLVTTFGQLLLSYGAEVGRFYFITDDINLEEFREQARTAAKENLDRIGAVSETTH